MMDAQNPLDNDLNDFINSEINEIIKEKDKSKRYFKEQIEQKYSLLKTRKQLQDYNNALINWKTSVYEEYNYYLYFINEIIIKQTDPEFVQNLNSLLEQFKAHIDKEKLEFDDFCSELQKRYYFSVVVY